MGNVRIILVFKKMILGIVGQIIDLFSFVVDGLVPSNVHLQTSQHGFRAIGACLRRLYMRRDHACIHAYTQSLASHVDEILDGYSHEYQMSMIMYNAASLAGQKLVVATLCCFEVFPESTVDMDLVVLPPHFRRAVILRNTVDLLNHVVFNIID